MEPQNRRGRNRAGPACCMLHNLLPTSCTVPMRRLALVLLPVLTLAPAAAPASQQGIVVIKKWAAMDKCAHQAQVAFPDYTPDSNAKRDAALRACLDGQNLPPRQDLPPAR